MPRGPHDDEIEENDPEKDHARQRLEELLRQREPNPPAPRKDEDGGADSEEPGRNPPQNPKP
jgi:hypothetical protein